MKSAAGVFLLLTLPAPAAATPLLREHLAVRAALAMLAPQPQFESEAFLRHFLAQARLGDDAQADAVLRAAEQAAGR
ncbi:MAG: hypothetical protein JNN13_05980 [Planctomycetes bacterium]|nr:hypothetical protein [Planctomycetota bacterium]